MKKQYLVILAIFISFISSTLAQNTVTDSIRIRRWAEDITALHHAIIRLHPNPYHSTSPGELNKSFNNIEVNLKNWSDNKIISEITALVASLKDGHSFVEQTSTDSSHYYMFHYFPLQTYVFNDGIYVINAPHQYGAMIGKKIIRIGNYKIDKVIKLLTPLINRDENNTYAIKNNLSFMIILSEYLNGFGIIDQSSAASFTVRDRNGRTEKYDLKCISFLSYLKAFHGIEQADLPLYRRQRQKYYWFNYLDENKTLYIKYNSELIDPQDSLTSFCSRMQKLIDSADVEKTIVDLRENQGGNAGTMQPLIDFLCRNDKINQRGKLYLIIGRRTQSAAAVFAVRMELNSKAIFVGEPTLTRPDFYSDARYVTLPNSEVRIGMSSILLNSGFPEDSRKTIEPDIKIDMSSDDFFDKKDPVLAYVLQDKHNAIVDAASYGNNGEKIIGKYNYGALQTAAITKDNMGKLWLRIDDITSRDFLNTELYSKAKNVYKTDVRTIDEIKLDEKNNNLIIKIPGKTIRLPKRREGSLSLQEMFQREKYDDLRNSLIQLSRQDSADNRIVFERYINSLGYNLLRKKKYPEALSFFLLNIKLYPNSANAYDSLAEAYMLSGDKPNAIIYYKKSLNFNPDNDGAKNKLHMLQADTGG